MKDRAELIELMARAMFAHANGREEWIWGASKRRGLWREHAEAALTALEAAGAVVVPKVATEEMLEMVAWRDEYAPDQGDY